MNKVNLLLTSEKSYHVAEAFHTLRANLKFCGPSYKAIMVTSCMQSDGKSTVSFEIANSFAEDGKKVLLLDVDLRRSVLQERVTHEKVFLGATEFLCGMVKLEDCICQTQYENLDIMFSGSIAPNPAELLGSPKFKELIETAKESYDMVIVDTPPLGAVIDAAVVAQNCDGAVLVISANTVSKYFAKNVLEQLKKSGVPVLGAVLNRVEIKAGIIGKNSYYRYGKYYKKYSRYGSGYGNYSSQSYGGYGQSSGEDPKIRRERERLQKKMNGK